MNIKADKASHQENRRRVKFLVTLSVFLLIIAVRIWHSEFLKDEMGIPDNMINGIMFYVITHIIVSFSRLSLVAIYLRRQHQQSGFRDNFIIGINQISNILTYIALGIAILLLIGINPREFFTSISIIAAAIAILFKDYITNMINGLILMFSNQIAIDDHIKIDDNIGKIVDITLLNVHLLSEDDDLIYIANSTILNGNIVNLTKHNQKKIVLEFALQPDQIKGLNELEGHLIESLHDYSEHIKKESANMRVVHINSTSVTIKFQLILNRQNRRMERDIRRHINWQIINYINQSKKLDHPENFERFEN